MRSPQSLFLTYLKLPVGIYQSFGLSLNLWPTNYSVYFVLLWLTSEKQWWWDKKERDGRIKITIHHPHTHGRLLGLGHTSAWNCVGYFKIHAPQQKQHALPIYTPPRGICGWSSALAVQSQYSRRRRHPYTVRRHWRRRQRWVMVGRILLMNHLKNINK